MENALFYTFSTIAQTLATAFALLGAFVLFRLQQIAATLEVKSKVVMLPYLPNEDARCLQAEGRYSDLLMLLDKLPQQNPGRVGCHSFVAARNVMNSHVTVQAQLRRWLVAALALTVAVIAGAVLVLTATPYIAISACISQVVFAVGIVAFGCCLTLYANLIWLTVKYSFQ